MKYHAFKSSQKGVGLPEILVAMLLLGIAVIGFAALQVRALDSTGDAMFRTQAMAAAQEFAERMRLNPTAASVYRADWTPTPAATPAAKAAALSYCELNVCTPQQMAQYDIDTMSEAVKAILPNGQIAVRPCIGRTNLCVYVSWNNTTPTEGSAAPHCSKSDDSYVLNADCVKLETGTL